MRLTVVTITFLLGLTAGAAAATLEPVGKFDQPIFVTAAAADPGALLVAEREGRVMQVSDGVVSQLADLTSLVSCCTSERGLLSIAPAPDFDAPGRFYAAYTGKASAGEAEGDIHVDAFRHEDDALLREPILTIGHADSPNHNGGQLQLGPDGYLYISTGDGGGAGDPLESGQSLGTLLGKILRVDPRPGQAVPYAIPPATPLPGAEGWPRSGAMACATPGGSPSTGPVAIWSSPTSARAHARRSTSR